MRRAKLLSSPTLGLKLGARLQLSAVARVIRIDDSYHIITIDQFARFMQEVNAFLAE